MTTPTTPREAVILLRSAAEDFVLAVDRGEDFGGAYEDLYLALLNPQEGAEGGWREPLEILANDLDARPEPIAQEAAHHIRVVLRSTPSLIPAHAGLVEEAYERLGRAAEATGLAWFGPDGEMLFQPPAELIAEHARIAERGRLNEACDALGAWMSAALDDQNVCAAMKADIQAWFDVGQPARALGPTIATLQRKLADERGGRLAAENSAQRLYEQNGDPKMIAALRQLIQIWETDEWVTEQDRMLAIARAALSATLSEGGET